MLLGKPSYIRNRPFSMTYILSSIHLEIVTLLWFLANCLALLSLRLSRGFLIRNSEGMVFPHHLLKLWLSRPRKLFWLCWALIACFCWACTALPVRKWGVVQEHSQPPDLIPHCPYAWNITEQQGQQMLPRKAYGSRWLGALIAEFLGSKCRATDTVVRCLSLVWDCVVLHHVWLLPYTTEFLVPCFPLAHLLRIQGRSPSGCDRESGVRMSK